MITLMIIGEVVFILPFVIVRIFRPTFLTVFDITNLELGTAFSAYGIVAMAAYFFGGPLADRFPPGRLIALSLIVTSLGGLVLITIPNIWMLVLVYAFFGASTILLFWSAFVKVQRQLGMVTGQGKSFGMVDAGRGLIAAFMASTSVFLLDGFLEVEAEIATRAQFTVALQWIIGLFTLITIICALLVMLVLDHSRLKPTNDTFRFKEFRKALSNRVLWQHALIVMCAYVGYKCTDDFSLFARDTFNYDDVEAAHLAAVTFWTRPLAAVICGVLADKWLTSKVVGWCFVLMTISSLLLSAGWYSGGVGSMMIITLTTTSVAIYGLRGIYFALFEESGLPMNLTGSGAGLVSLVGYTPDVFMGPLMGVILDNNPGVTGHQYLFGVLAGFSVVGFITSLLFRKLKSVSE